MLSRTALLVLGLAAVSMAQSTFTVVSAPSSVRFDKSAGALPIDSVGSALSASLGLSSDLAWPGLVAGSPFENPQASVVVVLDAAAGVPTGVAQFPLEHTEGSFASLASHVVASQAAAFAPVLSKVFAAASNMLSASASKEISSTSSGHSVHWDGAAMAFRDTAKTLTLTHSHITPLYTQQPLAGVAFDASAGVFAVTLANGNVVSLDAATYAALFTEAHALIAIAQQFATSAVASQSPASLALALSSLPSALAAATDAEREAIQHVAVAFVAAVTASMNEAFAGQVVVAAVSVASSAAPSAVVRVARDVSSVDAVNPQTGGKYKPNQVAFVEYCAEYRCFCSEAADGTPYDVATGCVKNCPTGTVCPCVYYGCSCNATSVINSQSVCTSCAPGYVLHGNSCYVDNGWVVQFNMVLGLGLLTVLSLIATCYAIGNMDPGHNSVIYRMTSGRLKTQ